MLGTLSIAAICVGVHAAQTLGRLPPRLPERVGFSYRHVVVAEEYWRALASVFVHANNMHLIFNMISLWQLVEIENSLGTLGYLSRSLAIFVAAKLISICLCATIEKSPLLSLASRQQPAVAVGYSGILFGWMALRALSPDAKPQVFFGRLILQPHIASVFSMFLTKIIVPNSSMMGHGSGILAGYLVGSSFCGDILNSFYWPAWLLFWVVLITGTSLRATTTWNVPFIDFCNTQRSIQPAGTAELQGQLEFAPGEGRAFPGGSGFESISLV